MKAQYRVALSIDECTGVRLKHWCKEHGVAMAQAMEHAINTMLDALGAPQAPSKHECRWIRQYEKDQNRKRKDEYVGQHFTF